MKTRIIKAGIICMLLAAFMTSGCGRSNDTQMKVSFQSSEPADSYDERQISIAENVEKLVMDMSVKVDSGEVNIQVIRKSDDSLMWDATYREDTDFKIMMEKVEAGSEYYLIVTAKQTKNALVTVNSETKLTKDDNS